MIDSTDYYDKIIQDLLEQREEIDRMLEDMRRQKKFAELRRGIFNSTPAADAVNQPPVQPPTAPIAGPATAITSPIDTRQPRGGDVTLVGGSVAILSKEGKPLHASKIVEKLADMGKVTNIKSLNSTLISDSQRRFRNYGSNTFGLSEWNEDSAIKLPFNNNGNETGNPMPIGEGLEQIFRKTGKEMAVADIIKDAREIGITASSNSIRATLSSDHKQRFKHVAPGVYTLKEFLETSDQLNNAVPLPAENKGEQPAS